MMIRNGLQIVECWGHLEISENQNQDKPDLEIHFFEPSGENFATAEEIFEWFQPGIILNECWISDSAWIKKLYKPKISTQSSQYRSFLNKWENEEDCRFIRLDEYISENRIDEIDLIKMDIEWAEFGVLLDIEDHIFKKIKSIFLEYHILDESYEISFTQLLTKLKKLYIYIEITESEHDSRIGYISAFN
ncbi:MAG: hypothetical protein ACD_2C00267G0003 [uncultured bacterium (gcode 4)]|uniref:Methyltransferase FkbM domain-containing protein n=1 Tax=uncultured bacterium (gcode 4) TaxID=1234023 RepID=K2FCR3_9BACT|nr:MAG: hypothetical protein ACD_2C00267G0003 [uncultured bacterium (gcode 4)]